MKVILSTAYWPNLQYFYYILNAEEVFIEHFEHYQKQSFRNRTQILTANGILDLSIPVIKNNDKELITGVEISYKENWQQNHWRAITTAYKNSPYFEFFEDEIKVFYKTKPQFLFEYNLLQLKTLLKILRVNKKTESNLDFEKETTKTIDLRNTIHPKIDFKNDTLTNSLLAKPYYQTFGDELNFTPNLSLLDLIFNKGLDTLDYLEYSK